MEIAEEIKAHGVRVEVRATRAGVAPRARHPMDVWGRHGTLARAKRAAQHSADGVAASSRPRTGALGDLHADWILAPRVHRHGDALQPLLARRRVSSERRRQRDPSRAFARWAVRPCVFHLIGAFVRERRARAAHLHRHPRLPPSATPSPRSPLIRRGTTPSARTEAFPRSATRAARPDDRRGGWRPRPETTRYPSASPGRSHDRRARLAAWPIQIDFPRARGHAPGAGADVGASAWRVRRTSENCSDRDTGTASSSPPASPTRTSSRGLSGISLSVRGLRSADAGSERGSNGARIHGARPPAPWRRRRRARARRRKTSATPRDRAQVALLGRGLGTLMSAPRCGLGADATAATWTTPLATKRWSALPGCAHLVRAASSAPDPSTARWLRLRWWPSLRRAVGAGEGNKLAKLASISGALIGCASLREAWRRVCRTRGKCRALKATRLASENSPARRRPRAFDRGDDLCAVRADRLPPPPSTERRRLSRRGGRRAPGLATSRHDGWIGEQLSVGANNERFFPARGRGGAGGAQTAGGTVRHPGGGGRTPM